MRKVILLAILWLVVPYSTFAQPTVFYENNSDSLCDVNGYDHGIYSWSVEHFFSISNADSIQTSLRCVFHIYTAAGSAIYVNHTRFYNGFDTLFGSTPSVYIDGTYNDLTVTIDAGPAPAGHGWPPGMDTARFFGISIWVSVPAPSPDDLIFDSTSSGTYGDWSATPGPTIEWIPWRDDPGAEYPVFAELYPTPNMDPVLIDCNSLPSTMQTDRFCDEMSLHVYAGGPIWGNASYIYSLVDGPGTIDSFTGIWTWTPSAADAEQLVPLEVGLLYKYCDPERLGPWLEEAYPRCQLDLIPGPNGPPTFANYHETEVTVSGQPLSMQCPVNDDDPCTDYTYSYFVPAGEPTPPIQCDPVTGEVSYPANPDDTNTYHFSLVVTEGQYADTTEITLYHWDSPLCGDMNHDGSSDIADLTWLVGYAFKGGVSPSPPEAGNVNCLTGIDVSDITYMVKYMFASGPDPCDCI